MKKKVKAFDPRRDRKGEDAWDHLETESKKRSSTTGLASVAASGDREAAIIMLRKAEYYIGQAEGIPEELQSYLLECFRDAILDGSTEYAFNLKQKDGRGQRNYQHHREWRDSQIAQAVAYNRDQRMSLTKAVEKVASEPQPMEERLGRLSKHAVKAAYLRYYPKEDN